MALTKTEKEYLENLAKIGLIGAGGAAGWQLKKSLAKVGYTKLGILAGAVAIRGGVEVAGLGISYAIDGEEGMQNWMHASNTIFSNRTFMDEIPIVGDLMTLLPNPLGVAEVLWDAGVMIGEETLPAFEGAVDFVQGTSRWALKQILNPPGRFFNPGPIL